MFLYFIVIFLISLIIPTLSKHMFPYELDMVNEFQLLNPSAIKLHTEQDNKYIIQSLSPLIINSSDVVVVSFNSNSPDENDWIGAYSPANVDITSTVPVKYAWCNEDDNYLSMGEGSLRFNFTNLRADIAFYYFKNGLDVPVMVNISSSNVSFADINEPLRPRMLATGDTDTFRLMWSSATSVSPTVKWGIDSGSYSHIEVASTRIVNRTQMGGTYANATGWRDLGLIHSAYLHGMKALAGSKIYYTFGDATTSTWSKEYIFLVPPLPGVQPPDRPTRVVVFADMGRGSTDDSFTWNEYGRPSIDLAMQLGAEVDTGSVDAVYLGGDISYATGIICVWDFFLDMFSPISSAALFFVNMGNHESDCPNTDAVYAGDNKRGRYGDSGGECGVTVDALLPMPDPSSLHEPWWSYDIGLIHLVGISTEHDYFIGSAQYQWLENDLRVVNRSRTPWIVFGGHRPMYINSDYCCSWDSDIVVSNNLIYHLEPLLWKYRVNIAFWGHNHAMQRQSAVLNRTVVQASSEREYSGKTVAWHENPQATVHIVTGTGGAKFSTGTENPTPIWNEKVLFQYGYARVTAVNASLLEWEWTCVTDGEVYDNMVITQNNEEVTWNIPQSSGHSDTNNMPGKNIIFILSVIGVIVVGYTIYSTYRRCVHSNSSGINHKEVQLESERNPIV